MSDNLKYDILRYWNDDDNLYVNYIITNKERDLKANVIAYFNVYDTNFNYNKATDEEIKNSLLKLIKKNSGKEFKLPKVSELSELLKDVYSYVCENDSNMCHIDEDDWRELCEEKNYTDEDFVKLKEEIVKYNLEDYITIDSDGYKICGYGGLQCCFNDDTIDRKMNLADNYMDKSNNIIEFENPGMGKCIILKQNSNIYKLIYSISAKQFIVIDGLNFKDGSWDGGIYFGDNLDLALNNYNEKIKSERELSNER